MVHSIIRSRSAHRQPMRRYRQYLRPIVSLPRFCCDAPIAADSIGLTEGENMKPQKVAFVLIATLFVFARGSFAQQVKTDYDHSADFAQYKTYSWGGVMTQDPLLVDRIKDAVNSVL